MKTWVANPVRFFSRDRGYLCRAAVLFNDWGDPPEVVHWSDRDGLHIVSRENPLDDAVYEDVLTAIERQGTAWGN